ncbi:MAG: N-formylglutamate amidohydrolase [Maricaulaceae bacterium]
MLPFITHNQAEAQCFAVFSPPITLYRKHMNTEGVVFASPHSGSQYPKAFTRRSRLPLAALRRNEDAYIDRVISDLPLYGVPTLKANFPRCFVDVNRAPDETLPEWGGDNAPKTARAAAGLGVVPTIISEHLPIYKTPLPEAVLTARLETLYYPYHAALKNLLAEAQDRCGQALLIDCHSMPGRNLSGKQRSDIILGDRFGASARPDFVQCAEDVFKAAGYNVSRNHPYAGGYVTSTYGQPNQGTHVIQIEVNRDIYMNPASLKLTDGFEPLKDCFTTLGKTLVQYIKADLARAAE